jgi:hypothetical protein
LREIRNKVQGLFDGVAEAQGDSLAGCFEQVGNLNIQVVCC